VLRECQRNGGIRMRKRETILTVHTYLDLEERRRRMKKTL
jgi:hypothetical protein